MLVVLMLSTAVCRFMSQACQSVGETDTTHRVRSPRGAVAAPESRPARRTSPTRRRPTKRDGSQPADRLAVLTRQGAQSWWSLTRPLNRQLGGTALRARYGDRLALVLSVSLLPLTGLPLFLAFQPVTNPAEVAIYMTGLALCAGKMLDYHGFLPVLSTRAIAPD